VVPPLRERIAEDPEELNDLLTYTVEKIVGKPSLKLVAMVRKTILNQLGLNYAWPGNVRELAQCVRRLLLKRTYTGKPACPSGKGLHAELAIHNDQGYLSAQEALKAYCRLLYDKHGTLGAVARITRLDRRTVKKYIHS